MRPLGFKGSGGLSSVSPAVENLEEEIEEEIEGTKRRKGADDDDDDDQAIGIQALPSETSIVKSIRRW